MYTNELKHWGIKGMKWGVRRYQKKDGTRTSAGKIRYSDESIDDKKQRILKSKSAKLLYQNADMFTTNELRDTYNRMVLEKNIKSFAETERVSKGKKALNSLKKINETINTINSTYRSIDTVSKLFGDAYGVYDKYAKSSSSFKNKTKKNTTSRLLIDKL